MNDPGKYIRLSGILFLAVTGVLTALVLVFLGLRLLFGFVNELPWITYIYTLIILSVPAILFVTVFSIFFMRTRSHASRHIRIISYVLFICFLCAWIFFYINDIVTFYRTAQTQVGDYKSWNVIFLTASVACIFIVGIIQALSSPKEEDWVQRNKRNNFL